MYIMYFNVSIFFKMGILYSYCDIITSWCTPQNCLELQDFVLILIKFSGGGPPDPPFKQNCLSLYYNHNTANILK